MAYEYFVPTTPNGGQRLEEFATSFRENITALRDAILYGYLPSAGFTYSQAGGTPRQPTAITVLSGNERIFVDLTWSNSNITTMITKYSATSSGGTTETASTVTASYDAAGELTAISGAAMGIFGKVLPLLGKIAKLSDDYIAHTAATTGVAAHGMGTLAAQNTNAVSLTGGNALGVSIGTTSSALAPLNCTYSREKPVIYGNYSGGQTVSADIAAGGWIEFSLTGTSAVSPATFSISNEPAASTLRGQIFHIAVYVPSGAGTQFITWNGFNALTINITQLEQNKTHIFIGLVRANGSTILRVIEYLGVLV